MPFSHAEISAHVSEQGELSWVRAADLAGDRSEACVDGRNAEAVIATPGGNAGELLLLLAAVENATGRRIETGTLDTVLEAYLARFGRFYMHGATRALATVGADLLGGAPSDDEAGARHIAARLANPPRERREELLDALSQPDAAGCGHIRLMLEDPEAYGVRRKLTEALLRAFFRALWRGAPVEYGVLAGGLDAGAVVLVTLRGDVSDSTRLPLLSPRVGERQLFVHHPQAASLLRHWEAETIADLTGEAVDLAALHRQIETLAERHMDHTLRALAPGLPIVELRFAAEGSSAFELIEKGHVPGP